MPDRSTAAVSALRDAPRIAVMGVGGYAGAELARLLLAHPRLQASRLTFFSRAEVGSEELPLSQLHPHLGRGAGQALPPVVPFDPGRHLSAQFDLVFLALPHETSRALAPQWLAQGVKIIDLSGAWRLKQQANREVYRLEDTDAEMASQLQQEAVYGCPELHRVQIAKARLVANPGCYATSIVLALAPLLRAGVVDLGNGIICDAKSGVSGAGKAPTAKTHFMYAADNLSAYAVFGHRHTGELLEQLGLDDSQIQFTPHLLPIPRGILSTIYVRSVDPIAPERIESILRNFYRASALVRTRAHGDLPQISHVVDTNYCDVGFQVAPDRRRIVLVSCLDNLLKGASGQAVQNMNLMFGYAEQEGLI